MSGIKTGAASCSCVGNGFRHHTPEKSRTTRRSVVESRGDDVRIGAECRENGAPVVGIVERERSGAVARDRVAQDVEMRRPRNFLNVTTSYVRRTSHR